MYGSLLIMSLAILQHTHYFDWQHSTRDASMISPTVESDTPTLIPTGVKARKRW